MILIPVNDYFKIEKLQEQLRNEMTNQPHIKKIRKVISWKSGEIDDDIFWSPKYSVWSYFRLLDERYWNVFGTEDPFQKGKQSPLKIDCEICVYTKYPDKKVAGVFVSDPQNNSFLIHTGKVGGGKLGWGRSEFWKRWQIQEAETGKYEKVMVDWPTGRDKAILISDMKAPNLYERVAGFIKMESRLQGD